MRSMKKILYILLPMLFALAACTEEMHFQDDTLGKDCIMLKVFNNPMTKVSDIGLDYERHLSRLDVFFYVEGQTDQNCVYYQPVTDPQYLTGAAEIPFYVVEEQINQIFPNGNSTCDVLVIANLPESKRTFDTDPDGGYENTEYNRLTAISLEMEQKDAEGNKLPQHYDAIDKDFVMAGFDGNVTKDNNNNASGEVKLVRAASKITVTVNVPEKIILDEGTDSPVTMVPVFEEMGENGQKMVSLKTAFFNGVSRGKVFPSGLIDDGMSVLSEDCYFETDKFRYTFVKEIPATTVDGVKKYQYTCEVPFYSYPSIWQKGDEHAAHFSLELPWKDAAENEYRPYYYQILINGAGRRLDPNHWYDLTVNVGVVGSSVELAPVELKDMSVYVLDWTTEPDPEDKAGGDRYENLEIEQYTYFSVPQKRIEMNNTTVGEVLFDASHSVKCKLEWPTDASIQETLDDLEMTYNSSKNYSAYYINCGGKEAVAASLTNFINDRNFTLSQTGQSIIFTYPSANITENVFSPAYIHAKLWLDIDGQGDEPNDDEVNFVEYVTFVYYPAMYIVPYLSVSQSVYVNSYRATSSTYHDDYIYINGWDLGAAVGTDNNNPNMHVITVSSFSLNDKFLTNPPGVTGNITYIIGDPRKRECDTNLNTQGYNMSASTERDEGWAEGPQDNGRVQVSGRLDHYYPTEVEGEAYRIVSPKFRIASRYGGYSGSDPVGAVMRCASYQEDGYPAGRWRLPTTAEIMFVVYLQSKGAIAPLFNGTSYYFSSTHMVQNNNGVKIANQSGENSVRCVYDEWYWGSNQDAVKNPNAREGAADEFLFTWGDAEVWPCENNH